MDTLCCAMTAKHVLARIDIASRVWNGATMDRKLNILVINAPLNQQT